MQKNSKLNRMSTFIDPKAGIEYNFEAKKIEDAMHEADPKMNHELNYGFMDSGFTNKLYVLDR